MVDHAFFIETKWDETLYIRTLERNVSVYCRGASKHKWLCNKRAVYDEKIPQQLCIRQADLISHQPHLKYFSTVIAVISSVL